MSMTTTGPQDEPLFNAIIRAAQDDSIDVVKLQALLDMQRQVEESRSKRMFNTAMAVCQSEMLPVIRDAVNTHTRSKYAKLETIDAQMRPIYTANGFGVRYGSAPCPREGWQRVTITISHSGGHWEESYLDAPPDDQGQKGTANKTPIQGIGSSVSYLRRYLLCMAFNIVLADMTDDDDGNASQGGNGSHYSSNKGGDPRDTGGDPRDAAADPLMEANGTIWLKNLIAAVTAAPSLDALVAIGGHVSVMRVKATAPLLIRKQVEDLFRKAHERLAEPPADDGSVEWGDPVPALIAEIDAMNADELDLLTGSASWKVKTRDLFPPDQERLTEAITLRRAALKGGTKP